MKLAKVLGTVVATEKDAKLGGLRFLMLGVWGHDNKPAGGSVVAVDAVGVAMLKHLGSNPAVMAPGIFELRQIKRAAELGIGVRAASEIDLVPADDASAGLSAALGTILSRG